MRYRRYCTSRFAIVVLLAGNASCNSDMIDPRGVPIAMQSDRIAASGIGTCIIQPTGTVCWGFGGTRRVTPADGSLRFVTISGGGEQVCGLTADSTAYCWGYNTYGELGDGTTTNRDLPTRVATSLKFVSITASGGTTCALDGRGVAYCWGGSDFGNLGDGTDTNNPPVLLPAPVATPVRFHALYGVGSNCGLTDAGRAYCWGHTPGSYDLSIYIAPGNCTTAYYLWYQGRQCLVPTPIATDLRFVSLAGDHCGLTADGEAFCWGDGYDGTFGDGRTGVYSVTPVRVGGGIHFAQLTGSRLFVCGIDLAGTAYCWGNNFVGELGIGDHGFGGDYQVAVPTPVATSVKFIAIASGGAHVCGLTSTSQVWCWGTNDYGELGPGLAASLSDVPVLVQLPPL